MKKRNSYINIKLIFTVVMLAIGIKLNAQVSIIGPATANVDEIKSYSLSSPAGTDTQWFIAPGGGQAVITQSNQNAARVRFDGSGTVVVAATVLDDTTALYHLTFSVSVSGGIPDTPDNPTIISNNCGAPVLQRNGFSSGHGDTWYWQGKTINGQHIDKGSKQTYTANEGNGTYYIRARSSTGQWSPGLGSVSVTINNLQAGSISGNQVICYNNNPTAFNNNLWASNGDGSYAYQWQVSTNNSTWTDISGATDHGYDSPTNLTSDRWYRRKVTSCGQSAETSSIKVTVKDPLDPGSINGIAKIIYGCDPPALTNDQVPTNNIGLITFQWQTSINNQNWTDITGADQSSYDLPPNFIEERWYRRGASSCGQIAHTPSVLVEVWPELFAGDISGNQVICYNTDPVSIDNAIAPSGGTGVYVYSWQSSPNGVDNWTNIDGATSATYDPPTYQKETKYYKRGVELCNFIAYTPTIVFVEVTPKLGAPTGLQSIDVCTGESVSLTLTQDSDANSIRWYDVASGGTHIVTGTIFTTPELNTNTSYYATSYNTTEECESITRTKVDINMVALATYFRDADNDGLGDSANSIIQCGLPIGYVLDATDNCPNVYDPSNACTILPPSSNPQDHNYLYTRTYQKSASEMQISTSTDLPFFSENDALIQQLTFFDGLGRPEQQLGIDQSPDMNDIVTHIPYDEYGRQQKDYLAYTVNDIIGQFNIDAKSETLSYYYNSTKYENTLNPFSDKDFEPSPANRVLKQAAPGNDWAMGQGHEIKLTYSFGGIADNVKHFEVSITKNGNTYIPALIENNQNTIYSAKQLYKNITKDENHTSGKNHTTEEFTNKRGQVVLKRTFADIDLNTDGDTLDTDETEVAHDTYYVYDDFGNLTFVLPPKMEASTATLTEINTNLDELGYQYTYDHRNRLVEKQIPGKDIEYIVYNKLDQPIMTQDANQRVSNEWLFTKYDAFGRVAYTGKAVDIQERINVQGDVDALITKLWVEQQISASPIGGADIYYNDGAYPISTLTEVLTVNYYDSYVDEPSGAPQSITILDDPNNATENPNVKGLATVSRVKVLDQSPAKWITTVSYYDAKGRPVYTYSENQYLETVDIIETQLDFIGKPLKSKTTHIRDNKTIITIDNFTYDHVGRLLAQTQCIGDETIGDSCSNGTGATATINITSGTITTEQVASSNITVTNATLADGAHLRISTGSGGEQELIVFNAYDELGQLQEKKVGGTSSTNYDSTQGLQKVDYIYTVRGWLKGVNEVANIGTDLFSFKIGYNEGNALYNGNIALTQWRSANQDSGLKTYNYTYDPLNRITGATGDTSNYNVSNIGYDKNGNIQSLTRNGYQNSSTFIDMDVLDYDYDNGNKLTKVTDDGNVTHGFSDSTADNQDYWYDSNGNMTRDLNKGIGSTSTDGITYNHLNLPINIVVNSVPNNGTISYIYDATGVKLQKNVLKNSIPTSTDYVGNYIYENDKLAFFSQPEGYVEPKNSDNLSLGFDYIYQYKDHLGNIRLSYKDVSTTSTPSLEIQEENNYYPFGLKHKGYNGMQNGRDHKYGFGGKEEQDEVGLGWMDFHARNYDPSIGRWMNTDPLEQFMSPYVYAGNDPIRFMDPSGMYSTEEWKKDNGITDDDLTTVYQSNSSNDVKPQLNDDGSISYITEEGDTIEGIQKQYNLEDGQAEELVGGNEIEAGKTLFTGAKAREVTGNQILALDLNSGGTTSQDILNQFVFSADYAQLNTKGIIDNFTFYQNIFLGSSKLGTGAIHGKGSIDVGGEKLGVGFDLRLTVGASPTFIIPNSIRNPTRTDGTVGLWLQTFTSVNPFRGSSISVISAKNGNESVAISRRLKKFKKQ